MKHSFFEVMVSLSCAIVIASVVFSVLSMFGLYLIAAIAAIAVGAKVYKRMISTNEEKTNTKSE